MDVIKLIEKVLDVRTVNHRIIAGNIANAETPQYKEKEIDFKQALNSRMTGMQNIDVQEKTESNGMGSLDGNTVSLEVQIFKMNENSMMYSALVQVLNKKFSLMRYLVNEGRR